MTHGSEVSLLDEATDHVRAAFAQKGRKVDVLESSHGVMLVEGDHQEFFEYPKAAELGTFGAKERGLGTLVAIFTVLTMKRVGGRRR